MLRLLTHSLRGPLLTHTGELDKALGLMLHCQQLHHLPLFHCEGRLSDLDINSVNGTNRLRRDTPLDRIPSTFLQVSVEIHRRDVQDHPPEQAVAIHRRLAPWKPCEGHPVIHASAWDSDVREHPGTSRWEGVDDIVV
jgi:hypothetical protein